MYDVRDVLRDEIEHRGFMREAIARRAGMKPQTLSDVFSKRRKLETHEFLTLCEAIDLSPDEAWERAKNHHNP